MKKINVVKPVAMTSAFAQDVYSSASTSNFEIPAATSTSENDTCVQDNGFLPITSTDLDNGGIAPERKNFNGLFYLSTDLRFYLQNGCFITYDAAVATAIGGYPKDAILGYLDSNNSFGLAQSLIDDNTYNFVSDPTLLDEVHWHVLTLDGANIALSNLSAIGNNRLLALKGYKDEGELLTDSEGLADVINYAHSTYDSTQLTVVGTPTVTDNGIASGFSSSNYLTSSTIIDTTKTWKAQLTLTTPTLGTSQVVLQLSQYFYLVFTTSKQLSFRSTNNTQTNWVTSTNTLSDNTEYDIEFGWNGSKIFLNYKPSNGNWINKPQTPSAYSGVSNATIESLGFGQSSYPFLGSIDLKKLLIIVDGATVFTANITGTDTYTIGGNTVSIPYTLSATGSKIADSAQRSNISALYAQQGYAPYYTLDEATGNFTLPQGEIYGMMLNQSTPHIIKTYINGTSGYIVLSNGWCVQRGLTDMSSVTIGAAKTVSLLKEMSAIYDSDNPYQVLNSIYTSGIHTNDDCPSFIRNQTSTSFDLVRAGGQSASEFWEVSGYLKAGEY